MLFRARALREDTYGIMKVSTPAPLSTRTHCLVKTRSVTINQHDLSTVMHALACISDFVISFEPPLQ